MEDESTRILNVKNETNTRKVEVESLDVQTQKDDPNSHLKVHTDDSKEGKIASKGDESPYAEFNMEAAMSSEDVIRAGGFGARDDISSCFPVASDSTDFEASLLDARGYEESPQKEIERPGLGYTK